MAGQETGVFSGLIHLACGFPYAGFYPGRAGFGVRFLAHIIPILTSLFGFYPGERVGFGGREYKRLMLDWRCWALKGGYDFPGRIGLEDAIAKYKGPYLSVAFDGDHFISELALDYSRSRLTGASHTHVCLTKEEQGNHLGHFDWAKEPIGVVRLVTAWIKDRPGLSR
jgi:predicted alpha/beta hydrolase